MTAVDSRAQKKIDEQNAQLAQKVEAAKWEQLEVQFSQDMELLKKRLPTPESEAVEAAKDQLFLRGDRGRTVFILLAFFFRFDSLVNFFVRPMRHKA